jgi:hypothetical protein
MKTPYFEVFLESWEMYDWYPICLVISKHFLNLMRKCIEHETCVMNGWMDG